MRWRGSPEKYQKENPMADKKREKYKQRTLNTETFVTLGEPTAEVLKPAAKGLDLEYLTHPNELYAGETAKFRAVYDGKPLANARVRLAKDGMRYRTHDFIELKSDADGLITIDWPGAGMYWLSVEHEVPSDIVKDAPHALEYDAGLEVLPL